MVNGSVHTACKQHQRVCTQICVQMCSRVLCERTLNLDLGPLGDGDGVVMAVNSIPLLALLLLNSWAQSSNRPTVLVLMLAGDACSHREINTRRKHKCSGMNKRRKGAHQKLLFLPSGFNPQTLTPWEHQGIKSRKLDIIGKYNRLSWKRGVSKTKVTMTRCRQPDRNHVEGNNRIKICSFGANPSPCYRNLLNQSTRKAFISVEAVPPCSVVRGKSMTMMSSLQHTLPLHNLSTLRLRYQVPKINTASAEQLCRVTLPLPLAYKNACHR